MIQNSPRPNTTNPDPARLVGSGTGAAALLRAYLKQTRPSDRDGVSAWYRLRLRLDAGPSASAFRTPLLTRWLRAWLLSSVITVAIGILVLVKLAPASRAAETVAPGSVRTLERRGEGDGGGMEGAGGMEGSSGARGAGGTTAAGGLPLCLAHLC